MASEIGPDDYVLSIGTTGLETPKHEQGKLLALMKIGPELIATRDAVSADFYSESVATYGEKWPFAFPIKSAERFTPTILRTDALPRIGEKNLYRTLARHYVELTPSEVQSVLSLARVTEQNLYSSPRSAFASRMRKAGAGAPPPASGTRLLSHNSGPAVTYLMELTGTAIFHVSEQVIRAEGHRIFKIGFSNDHLRRLKEMNAHLPCEISLHWHLLTTQLHDDEINAYALEQEIFRILERRGVNRFKGEMVEAELSTVQDAWEEARKTATRPDTPIVVDLPAR